MPTFLAPPGTPSPGTPSPATPSPATRSRTAAGIALCLLGALTLAASPAAAEPARAATADPLARYHHQQLAWKSCLLGPDDATGNTYLATGHLPSADLTCDRPSG